MPRVVKLGKQQDTRRNLYVLGLPFDLTKFVVNGVLTTIEC